MLTKFASTTTAMLTVVLLLTTVASADERHINDSAADASPLKVGQSSPNASLLTLEGKETTLRKALNGQPTVIVFFRGVWCPFCTKHLASLSKVLPELKERGYQVMAISPDTPAAMQKISQNDGVLYYSDPRIEAAARYGLAFRLDDATSKRYDGFGIKIQPIEGLAGNILPVPAVFVLDKQGKITFAHYDPDYKQRLSAEKILEAAK